MRVDKLSFVLSNNLEFVTVFSVGGTILLGACSFLALLYNITSVINIFFHFVGLVISCVMIIYWGYINNSWHRYGGCPLAILSDFGVFKFFRACRLKYKSKFWEAMVVYLGYFPCYILHIVYFIYCFI